MAFFEYFKSFLSFKITFFSLTFLFVLKQLFVLTNIFTEYFWLIDLLSARLCYVLGILTLLQIPLVLSLVRGIQEEMIAFNEGPKDKSFFMAQVRRYHFLLIFCLYLFYFLGTTYFVEDPVISYLLGMLASISLILYLVQFVVYTKDYIKKSLKSNEKSTSSQNPRKVSIRNMVTSANVKMAAIVCIECIKTVIVLGSGVELIYKMSHGGMNDISPWRQELLNRHFPEDGTKVWTEEKLGKALQCRATGIPINSINESEEEKIEKAVKKVLTNDKFLEEAIKKALAKKD